MIYYSGETRPLSGYRKNERFKFVQQVQSSENGNDDNEDIFLSNKGTKRGKFLIRTKDITVVE